MKEKLKRMLESKAFYIVFSILASMALWVYVEVTQNPNVTATVDPAAVVLLNEEVLHDRNLVVTNVSPESVWIKYECKRDVQAKLRSSSVTVTVDLSGITAPGVVPLAYTPVLPADVNSRTLTEVSRSVARIYVVVDNMYEKSVPVVSEYKGGTASDEYFAELLDINPDTITVYGPEAAVSRIDRAWVPILRENLARTYTDDLPFVLQDENGDDLYESMEAASGDGLSFSQDTVNVTVRVSLIKDVALWIDPVYGSGATAQNTLVTVSPSSIKLSGDPELMKDFNSITLGPIDFTKFETSTTETFTIVIPNNMVNLSGETEAAVGVVISGLETRHFIVTSLEAINTPRGYTSTVLTQSLDVRIRGSAEALDAITAANISVVADLSDFKSGTTSVAAKVHVSGYVGDAGPVGDYKIAVQIVKD